MLEFNHSIEIYLKTISIHDATTASHINKNKKKLTKVYFTYAHNKWHV